MAFAVATLLVAATPLFAQGAGISPQWTVRRSAAADAWFHALALLDVDAPGPLRFYSADYAASERRAKRQHRGRPTLLDRTAPAIRRAVLADSAFEALHFLPLYVDADDPTELIATVRSVASGMPAPTGNGGFVTALRALFATEKQRATLSLLADAVEDEWRASLQQERASSARADEAAAARLNAAWNARFAPALAGFLRRTAMTRGEIWIVPSIGEEGRITTTTARGGRTIVVVGRNAGAPVPDAPLLAAVRELCFPVITAGIESRDRGMTRSIADAARENSNAAAACGASLLDQTAPLLARDFRRMYPAPARRVARPY